jgi:hypothetical protein
MGAVQSAAASKDDLATQATTIIRSIYGGSDSRPIEECLCYNDDHTLNEVLYQEYQQREEDEEDARKKLQFLYLHFALGVTETNAQLKNATEPSNKRARMQHPKFFTDPTTGYLRSVTPKLSLWWILYIQDPQPNSPQWAKTFRKRFRLP